MKKPFLFVFLFGCIFAFVAVAMGEGTSNAPTRAIQDLDKKMEAFKTGRLTPQEKEYNQQLKRDIIHGTFDIRELAKLSLSKHWDTLTAEKQDEFVELLTNLLEEKALLSKEQSATKSKRGGKYVVRYLGDKFLDQDKLRSFVRTSVHVYSENVTLNLNYKVRKQENEWKIFDVIVDEASLVDNYKYQFDSIIKKHGYAELVKRMREKLTSIQGKRQAIVDNEEENIEIGARK